MVDLNDVFAMYLAHERNGLGSKHVVKMWSMESGEESEVTNWKWVCCSSNRLSEMDIFGRANPLMTRPRE